MAENETTKKGEIIPIRMSLDSRFQFRCHKDVPCFTDCCRGIDIMLTPYDIIRMKKALDIPSDDFLRIYTELKLLEKTDLPVVTMKLLDDERKSCPFVRDGEGCLIYEDRPTTCRYYPLGVGSLAQNPDNDGKDFYFLLKEPVCKGHEEEEPWTVREYRVDQGVDVHDEMNALWTDVMVRKKSYPDTHKLTERSKQMYFMACYNVDQFRRFVFDTDFLKIYSAVGAATIEKIREDDVELLNFGCKWIISTLFKTEAPDPMFIPNPDAVKTRGESKGK